MATSRRSTARARFLAVLEAGIGFGFMAVVIGYLPTLYQAFSERERTIGLLDARAGSPPTAAELLGRLAAAGRLPYVETFLQEWEAWSADLLDNHLSFPVLSFYRSQHENQSWLAALTVILDTCSLLMVGVKAGRSISGPAHVRHGPACRGRSGPGPVGSAAQGPLRAFAPREAGRNIRQAAGGRMFRLRRRPGREKTGRAAGHVRAGRLWIVAVVAV